MMMRALALLARLDPAGCNPVAQFIPLDPQQLAQAGRHASSSGRCGCCLRLAARVPQAGHDTRLPPGHAVERRAMHVRFCCVAGDRKQGCGIRLIGSPSIKMPPPVGGRSAW
jgi:hypothetical protein